MASLSWRSSSLHFFAANTLVLQFHLIVTWLLLSFTGLPTYGCLLGPLRYPLESLAGAHIALTSSLEALADFDCLLPIRSSLLLAAVSYCAHCLAHSWT
jgi:hypothetical protein